MPPRAKRNTSKPADEEPVVLDDAPTDPEPDGDAESNVVEPEPDESAPQVTEPDICRTCFPAGWPMDAYSAGCEHGSWLHHQRAAAVTP